LVVPLNHCWKDVIYNNGCIYNEVIYFIWQVDSFVKIFPGVSHGWSVRYDVDDKLAAEKAEEAQKDMLDWFVKYVK
jgi:carboxymethylenebutenolidase